MIIPARYLNTTDPNELAGHVMEDIRKGFMDEIAPGDIIVAGTNFGCGSSREHAPLAIKAAGISCVIARSFARIFYRNSFNIGLVVIECEEGARKIDESDELEVDQDKGLIRNLTKNETYQAEPIPPFMQELVRAGGLINYVKGIMK
ncbi:2,3-dimethylmalate dehydratase small subunit [subsurface metagenome]